MKIRGGSEGDVRLKGSASVKLASNDPAEDGFAATVGSVAVPVVTSCPSTLRGTTNPSPLEQSGNAAGGRGAAEQIALRGVATLRA
jgi:hypothetical protein